MSRYAAPLREMRYVLFDVLQGEYPRTGVRVRCHIEVLINLLGSHRDQGL